MACYGAGMLIGVASGAVSDSRRDWSNHIRTCMNTIINQSPCNPQSTVRTYHNRHEYAAAM
jgi:hypothetical protein